MSEPSRRSAHRLGRTVWSWSAYALAGIALLAAAALAGVRLLLPELGRYESGIETLVSRIAQRPVEFGAVEADWRGWTPVFRLKDVQLAGDGAAGGGPAEPWIRLADLTFSIDLLESLRSGALEPREIAASGASLTAVRRADGTISVQALESRPAAAAAPPDDWSRFVREVLDRTSVSLSSSRILWVDERRDGRTLPLTGVTLRLERDGGGYRASGWFELPGAARIDLVVALEDEPFTPSWSGKAYVGAHEVDLEEIGLEARQLGAEGVSGRLSGMVWSTWERGRLVEAEGTVRAQSPGLVVQGSRRGFDEVSASLKVERTVTGWTLAAEDLVVATPNGSWPSSSVAAEWSQPRAGREATVVVNAEFLRIEDLVALAATSREPENDAAMDTSAADVPAIDAPGMDTLGMNTLLEAAPRGVIEDLQVSAPVAGGIVLGRARARGRFADLHVDSADWPASVEAATGRFEVGAHGMVVEVAGGALRVGAPRWLAEPLRGEDLTGVFTALPSEESLRVRFDRVDLTTAATGRIAAQGWLHTGSDGGRPELSVALSMDQAGIAPVRDLVARDALPEPTRRWLEQAVPDGEIRDARLAFRGHLPQAPAEAPEGTLEVTAALSAPVFSYARGWPALHDVSAVVRFEGSRLEARIASGSIFGASVRDVNAAIDDLGAEVPMLRVEGSVEGTSADAVRFLAESPLRDRLKPALDAFAIDGPSTVDLRLGLPLKGATRAVTVEGEVALDDNRIDFPQIARGPEAVNGVLAFRGTTVESDGITATWAGEPLHAVVEASLESPDMTRLSFDGRLTPRLLATLLQDAGGAAGTPPGGAPPGSGLAGLAARLDGDTAWSAVVDIPHPGSGNPVTVRGLTDLAGIALDLPSPFGKPAASARRLSVESRITPGAEHVVSVRYGDIASATLRLVADAGGLRLDRGAVVLGPGDAALPDAPGLTVQGEVPALDTGAWQAFVQEIAPGDASRADASPLSRLREVSVDAGSVSAIGARFPATRIRAAPDEDGRWRLVLEGRGVDGTVHIPRDPYAEPITAEFERFVLDPEPDDRSGNERPGSERLALDPRGLPALSFSSRHFVLGERDLGQVTFATVPSEEGMRLERLDVQAGAFNVQGTGSWSHSGEADRTGFVVRMHGDDLGRMLDALGFDGDVVSDGKTDISLRGSWAGTPADFALERIAGVMHFLSVDGRLTQVEPGVTGRVFGLLTITSLPRRLILDFSDLFKEGFEFDRIDGTFAIENGHAYTDDLLIESNTARIDIVGRTGLVTEDYDQLVTVIPKISSIPPLVPLWLAQKIFDHNVFDKAFSYQYAITGTWDAPVIELVKTQRRVDNDQ